MEQEEQSKKKHVGLAEPSENISKTRQKIREREKLFLSPDHLPEKEKKEVLKNINEWIALHHSSRYNLSSQTMGLFKNNEETAEPSRLIKQIRKKLQQDFSQAQQN